MTSHAFFDTIRMSAGADNKEKTMFFKVEIMWLDRSGCPRTTIDIVKATCHQHAIDKVQLEVVYDKNFDKMYGNNVEEVL